MMSFSLLLSRYFINLEQVLWIPLPKITVLRKQYLILEYLVCSYVWIVPLTYSQAITSPLRCPEAQKMVCPIAKINVLYRVVWTYALEEMKKLMIFPSSWLQGCDTCYGLSFLSTSVVPGKPPYSRSTPHLCGIKRNNRRCLHLGCHKKEILRTFISPIL